MANKGVLILESYYEVISELSDDEQLIMFKGICEYGINGIEPNFKGALKSLFTLMKPNIDSSISRYNSSVTNGGKGGRPKKTETKEEPKQNPVETKEKPKEKPIENQDKDIDKDIDKEKDILEKHKLVIWLEEYCPEVQKLKKPITNKEAEKIQARFKGKFKTVESVFLRMENHKGLSTKYKSAYLTFCQWVENMKPEVEQNESILKNPTSVPYPINLY
jgi:hypothetical protein